ncbi:hypothetical protein AMATHDRAFT_75067 [Amanita thiersii Skay4041]|uniref:Nucleolar protein 12 n=1 Tax=Amanita thiersii Skay4041 TaxID=703135 RepID=A0A2A9NU79_9AGAR|nr:hypothetical protein AMATHDRAFT_75067 [Amanita thiersii Skay4041]
MGLGSFLLPSVKDAVVDKELDDLFKSNVYAGSTSSTVKPIVAVTSSEQQSSKVKDMTKRNANKRKAGSELQGIKGSKRARVPDAEENEEEESLVDGSDSQSEEAGSASEDISASELENEDHSPTDDTEEDEAPFNPSKLVHESLVKSKKHASKDDVQRKSKWAPAGETSAQRDARTIFIGNLSVEVARKRPLQKSLKRRVLEAVPGAKIESMRFRSVPFEQPTSKLDLPEDGKSTKSKGKEKEKEVREHDRIRTSTWRASHPTNEDDDNPSPSSQKIKQYLTPSQKKRISFINHAFHPSADVVNAYIVFAHPVPSGGDKEGVHRNPPPSKDVLDPYEVAKKAARECDGMEFEGRVVRVDLVRRGVKGVGGKVSGGGSNGGEEAEAEVDEWGGDADPKLTVFVGNLDFASKEDDLRAFFEGVVSKERGLPPSANNGRKTRMWVTRVRIIRDKETQLGKGFAYVQFADRECVDEILAIEAGNLKFAKRKLRIQRCKTVPGSSISTRHFTSSSSPNTMKSPKSQSQKLETKKHARIGFKPAVPLSSSATPKGDPRLGDKIRNLSKEERKQAKAGDADRVARRLAKKKARMAMGVGGTPGKVSQGGKQKERVRARKREKAGNVGAKKGGGAAKKGKRVRSEKGVAKLNTKK